MKIIFDEQAICSYLQGIQHAEKEILISCFKFNLPKKEKVLGTRVILEHLINARHRGVSIKVLIHFRQPRDEVTNANRDVVRRLKAENIDIRCLRNNRMCHAKFIVLDESIAILGSHNLSMSSLRRNFEASIIFQDVIEIKQLTAKFYDLFRTAQPL